MDAATPSDASKTKEPAKEKKDTKAPTEPDVGLKDSKRRRKKRLLANVRPQLQKQSTLSAVPSPRPSGEAASAAQNSSFKWTMLVKKEDGPRSVNLEMTGGKTNLTCRQQSGLHFHFNFFLIFFFANVLKRLLK